MVDDDAEFCEVVAEILRDEGHIVACAANGSSALERLREDPLPTVILLDLAMPVMNGWSFLSELQQDARFSAVPVVLLSGIANIATEAEALGVTGCITKPVAIDSLKNLIAALQG